MHTHPSLSSAVPTGRRPHHLTLVLLALLFATVVHGSSSSSNSAPSIHPSFPEEHRCGFDALQARTIGTRVSGIARVVQPDQPQRDIDAVVTSSAWQPIRIRVFTEDLNDDSKHCTKSGQKRPNFEGSTATCTKADILTDAKKTVLTELLIPSAIQLHEDRLNVQRVNGNIVVNGIEMSRDQICGQFTVPASHTTTGVSDADFVLYMSAGPTSGNTIAWATTCQNFADTGRPAVGVSNVSPKYIAADPQTTRVITHELLHALGFSSATFDALKMTGSASLRGKGLSPVLTSPNVVAKAQAQYGCSTQAFMELEDEGGDGTAYSHWKRRSAKDELMAGISGVGHYTALTIAAMEDMGFYKGNYANAEPMSYGQNAGCSLTTTKCVIDGVSQFTSMFCGSTSSNMVCTSDHTSIGSCAVGRYSSALPTYFQYFSDPTLGGTDSLMDYCPYVQEYSNTNCTVGSNVVYGNVYGLSSRCFNVPSGFTASGGSRGDQLALCANVQCDSSTLSYGVKVAGASSYTTCTPGATMSLRSLSSKFTSGSLTCPSYDEVCVGQVNATEYQQYIDLLKKDTGDGALSLPTPVLATVVLVLLLGTGVVM